MDRQKTEAKFDFSSLYKKEDWWACWVGLFILALCIPETIGTFYKPPKVSTWSANPLDALTGDALVAYLVMFIGLAVLYLIAVRIMGERVRTYVQAFLVVFIIGIIANVIG
ncbi:hypothetical protein ACFLXE_08345, partial [Chloroflexota bacterium]